MQIHPNSARGNEKDLQRVEKTIREWEGQYPDTWLLLKVTAEDEGEPIRGVLIAMAADPEDFQEVWRSCRNQGMLTMLTYGPPIISGPEVIVSAT
jgi:hypothetical protein